MVRLALKLVDSQVELDFSVGQNVSYFNADTLTQKIIVISRGRIGVAEGGSAGTTKHDSGLRFPATTSKADKQAVWDKLIEQGFKVLRQVP